MSKALGDLTVVELEKMVKAASKPFEPRNDLYENRRKVRFRQMEKELKALPLSNRAGANQALLVFQTEEPNQEVHRRVKRLVANKPRIECIIYDGDEDAKIASQEVKDALKALWKWMNRGKTPPDRISTSYQQGDGCGWLKLDFIPSFSDETLAPYDIEYLEMEDDEFNGLGLDEVYGKARKEYRDLRDKKQESDIGDAEASTKSYSEVTDKALRRCDPPFRLSAPDPVTIVHEKDGDAIVLVIEKGKRKVSALLDAFGDNGLRLIANRLVVNNGGEAAGDATIPENGALHEDYKDVCDYTEIRTRHEIVILMRHPQLAKNARKAKVEDDYVRIAFENPFGPYSTGYIPVPGDITGSHDPAHEFQPPILGTLSLAQPLNVLETARLSAAIDKALAGKYIKVDDAQPATGMNAAQTDKTPGIKDGKPIPVIPGEVRREEASNIDLDKSEQLLNGMMNSYRFNEVLAGDAQSSDSGHKLAIQVSQADTQLVPYQNARAEAIAEVLMCCLYATKKHGSAIWVKELPDNDGITMNKTDKVAGYRALRPEMFDLDFNLVVTIGSETPVTKFAKWSALEQRFKAGTLSFETLMEQSDVENVSDEIARIFEGQTLTAVMQQAIPVVVKMIADRALAKLTPQPAPGPGEVVGEGGNANGGGMPGAVASTPVAGIGRLPGVGLSPAGPTVGEDGPRVNEGAGDGQAGVG
jgi:hypothetical protein